ncbi:MAG: type II toxin-antitoxin system VapC family toxin [Xanthomonadales bacterium]|nr:type II toxin-antitoxin system VapC family toxin [Xanthomonadales bacterium]
MIAVDTNFLLRYLLGDDPAQSEKAEKLFIGNNRVLVTDVVLVETLWTLKGKKYQLGKTDLMGVVRALFEESNIRFEDGQVVWMALNDYRKAKPVRGKVADFADALIINKAKFIAKSLNISFSGSYTFDKAAQALAGAKAPI